MPVAARRVRLHRDREGLPALAQRLDRELRPRGRGVGVEEAGAPLERRAGFPVVAIEGPDGRKARLQVRPRGTEATPLCRTASFDLVRLPPEGTEAEDEADAVLLGLLVEVIRRNDR